MHNDSKFPRLDRAKVLLYQVSVPSQGVLPTEYLCAMLCCQSQPFVCVSYCLMKKGGEGRKYKSGLQLIGKAKPSELGLLLFLSAKSTAGYLFVCVAHLSLWVFTWFEGKLDCLLVIWEGHKAFPDLV